MMDPKARNTIGMGIPGEDTLGSLNADYTGPIFPEADLVLPNLEPIIRDLPDDIWLRITKAVKDSQDENARCVQAWSSMLDGPFRSVYSVSVDLINGVIENLRAYGKLVGALDLRQQTLIRRSGPFLRLSSAQLCGGNTNSKVKEKGALQGPLAKSTASQKKKVRNKGKSRKN